MTMGFRNRRRPWFPNAGHPSPLFGRIMMGLIGIAGWWFLILVAEGVGGGMLILWIIFAVYFSAALFIALFAPEILE
jgi:hypothetical protein